jgi:hypothetical protein
LLEYHAALQAIIPRIRRRGSKLLFPEPKKLIIVGSFDVMSDGHTDRRISSSRHLQALQIAFLCITPGVLILTDCLGSSYHERRNNNDQDSLGDIHARNQYRYGGTS